MIGPFLLSICFTSHISLGTQLLPEDEGHISNFFQSHHVKYQLDNLLTTLSYYVSIALLPLPLLSHFNFKSFLLQPLILPLLETLTKGICVPDACYRVLQAMGTYVRGSFKENRMHLWQNVELKDFLVHAEHAWYMPPAAGTRTRFFFFFLSLYKFEM